MTTKDSENRQPCACIQAVTDLLKAVSPIKEGMLKEVKCKRCGKTFLTNFGILLRLQKKTAITVKKPIMDKVCTPWYSTIFPETCDGCAPYGKPRCVEYCSNGVFAFKDGKAIVANPHKCVNGCTACEPICLKKAISFSKPDFALTPIKSEDKGLLRKTTCAKCGKVFWTNRSVDLCFECESKF